MPDGYSSSKTIRWNTHRKLCCEGQRKINLQLGSLDIPRSSFNGSCICSCKTRNYLEKCTSVILYRLTIRVEQCLALCYQDVYPHFQLWKTLSYVMH